MGSCVIGMCVGDMHQSRNRGWKRKLMQSSETSVTGGLSTETESIPSVSSYTSLIVFETYTNWDGEENTAIVDEDWFQSIISILGVIVVIAAIIAGAVFFIKKRKAKKAQAGSGEYVLMEND